MRLCSADRWWLLHVRQPWAKPPRRASTNSRRAANHVVAAKQQPVSFSLLVSSTGHNRHCLLIIHSTRSIKLNHFTPLGPLELASNLNLTVIRLDDHHQVLIVFVVTGCMHNNHFWWFFLSVSVSLFFFESRDAHSHKSMQKTRWWMQVACLIRMTLVHNQTV